jgi:hypothetical protein
MSTPHEPVSNEPVPHGPAPVLPERGRPEEITDAARLLRQALNTLVSRDGMALAALWRITDHDPCSQQSRAVLAHLADTALVEDKDGQIQAAADYLFAAVERYVRRGSDAVVREAAGSAVSTLDSQMGSIQTEGAIRSAGIRVARLTDQVSSVPTARLETTWRELPLWEVWSATLGPDRSAQSLPVQLMADWMQDVMPQVCDWLWTVKDQFEEGWFDKAETTLRRIDEALTILEQPVEVNDQPMPPGLVDLAATGLRTEPADAYSTDTQPGPGGDAHVDLA